MYIQPPQEPLSRNRFADSDGCLAWGYRRRSSGRIIAAWPDETMRATWDIGSPGYGTFKVTFHHSIPSSPA